MADYLDSADDELGIDYEIDDPTSTEAQAVVAPAVEPAATEVKEPEKAPEGAAAEAADTVEEKKLSFTLEEEKKDDDDPISALAIELGFSKEQAESIKTVKELRELTANELRKFSSGDEVARPDLSAYDAIISADLEDEDTILDLARQRLVQTGMPDPDKLIARMEDDELLKLAETMKASAVSARNSEVRKYNEAIEAKEKERIEAVNKIKEREEAFENSFIEACKNKQVTLDGFEIDENYARRVLDIRRHPERYGLIEDLNDPQKIVDMITAVSSDKLVAHVRTQLKQLRKTKAESEFVKKTFEDRVDLKVDMAKNGGAQKVLPNDNTEMQTADDSNILNI